MFKLESVLDPKEAATIARRRRNEEERKKRLFDPRTRLIGIDVQALEKQLNEKREIEIEETFREKAFDEDRIRNDKIALVLEKRLEEDRKELGKSINQFRCECQKAESRREFDLNDPHALKKELPARISDDDPRCTLSSIQKFEGEDPNKEGRAALQKQQIKNWLLQQCHLRKEAEDMQKKADALYFKQLEDNDRRAVELQHAENSCREAIKIALRNYNAALAKQKEQERVFEKQREIEDNYTEISNAIFGDILNEKPETGESAFGPKKISTTNWKGFTPEQLADIRRVQKEQIEEKQMIKEKEHLAQQQWDSYMETMAKSALVKEIEEAREKYITRKKLLEENKELAAQQKSFQNYLDKEIYVSKVSEDFFKQFNTSAR